MQSQPDGAGWEKGGDEWIPVSDEARICTSSNHPVGQVWLSKEPMFKQSMPVPKIWLEVHRPLFLL